MKKRQFLWWSGIGIIVILIMWSGYRQVSAQGPFFWPTNLQPDAVTLSSAQDITLTWNKGQYITSCDVYLFGSDSSAHDVNQPGVTASSYHIGLLPPDVYDWSLICRNNQNSTASEANASFDVGNVDTTPPPVPGGRVFTCAFSGSKDGVNTYTVTYRWNAVSDMGTAGMHQFPYWSQVSTKADFSVVNSPDWYNNWDNVLVRTSGVSYSEGTMLYAHVRSRDTVDNKSPWSEINSLTVNSSNCFGAPIESGFSMTHDAWNFQNARYNIPWQVFTDTFAKEDLEADGRPTAIGRSFYEQLSSANGGLCFGYVLSSAGIYAGFPGYVPPLGKSNLYEVPSPKRYDNEYIEQGIVGNYIARYYLFQNSKEYSQAQNAAVTKTSDVLNAIRSSVNGKLKQPLILELIYPENGKAGATCTGHGVLPYAYRAISDGYAVKIYDPNRSAPQSLEMQFGNDGSWSYDDLSSSLTCKRSFFIFGEVLSIDAYLRVVPLEFQKINTVTLPWWGAKTVVFGSNAELVGKDLEFIVPINRNTDTSDSTNIQTQYEYTGTQPIEATVYYTNTAISEVRIFSSHGYLKVAANEVEVGTSEQVTLDPVNLSIAVRSKLAVPHILQTVISDTVQTGHQLSCILPVDSLSNFTRSSTSSRLTTSNALSECIYSIQPDAGINRYYVLPRISARDTLTMTPSQNDISVLIDHNSNGTIDEIKIVTPAPQFFLPLIKR